MRVIECDCGATLQAETDEELESSVREHVASDHPDMQLDDDQVRDLIASKAHTANDS